METSFLTREQLYTYYADDREIFSKLVLTFKRDPAESLLIMSLWLWLEDKGFPSIVPSIPTLPDHLIHTLVDEAISCIRCLDSSVSPSGDGRLPLTVQLMNGPELTLHMIYELRYSAIAGIKNFLSTVCTRIFCDILQLILPSSSFVSHRHPLIIPGFPHPTFGNVTIVPDNLPTDYPIPSNLWRWNSEGNVTEDDRTIFLTFSRGFPVTQTEVRKLFTSTFGEAAVENLYMQEGSEPNGQPLFARLVLDSVATVDRLLCGQKIAKFRMNGKHIWARKYERRDHLG